MSTAEAVAYVDLLLRQLGVDHDELGSVELTGRANKLPKGSRVA